MKQRYYIIEITNGVYFSGELTGSGYSDFQVTTEIDRASKFYSLMSAKEITREYTGQVKTFKIFYELGDI